MSISAGAPECVEAKIGNDMFYGTFAGTSFHVDGGLGETWCGTFNAAGMTITGTYSWGPYPIQRASFVATFDQ